MRLVVCASHAPGMIADLDEAVGHMFRNGLRDARTTVADFNPDLVVMFGSDHRRAYEPVIPAISVVMSAEGYGDHGSPTGEYRIPTEKAEQLAEFLLRAGFDVAASRGVRLDHGFGETLADLLGGLDRVPILPIFINCATPPLADPRRAVELGSAVDDFLSEIYPGVKVLIVASGGLSHAPPTLEVNTLAMSDSERKEISVEGRARAAEKIKPEWDAEFLARLRLPDTHWLMSISQDFIDEGGVGANEVRTWLASWAAAGRDSLTVLGYEPVREWITGMGVVCSSWAAPNVDASTTSEVMADERS
jgi:2,3-dihydroxyphenylpropionate 1,2-dioxygenase